MNHFDITEYTKEDESIIKSFEPKDDLCPSIFDQDLKMHKNIRKKLIEVSNNFLEYLGVEFFVHDIRLTGSMANYNWSKYSDVDVHIIIDFEDQEYSSKFITEFFNSKKENWNNLRNVKIKNFDVELYVQDVNEKHSSSGVYSILNNKWVIEPSKQENKIDKNKILNKADYYANIIDKTISNSNSKNVEKTIYNLFGKIKKFRKSGLETKGEYSYENLTFKLLRRNGYIKKLLDLKNKVIDKNLSITQQ
jgi:predicted nucleotidyltransferase